MKILGLLGQSLLAISLIGCSSKNRPVATPAAPAMSADASAVGHSPLPPVVKPKEMDDHGAKSHHAADAHAEMPAPKNLGQKELTWLKNGNSRFVKNTMRNDFKTQVAKKALLQKLSGGQKPHTIVLSCSDSRVPPELVFDQVMGEIFVIRVAGEALDSSVIASIEYAAEHLGSQMIVVMGHESCGAVKAALSTPEGQSAGSESLDRLVADIRPRIAQTKRTPIVNDVLVESWANAKGVAHDLLARSPILATRVGSGKLKVVSALYHLGSGIVEFE